MRKVYERIIHILLASAVIGVAISYSKLYLFHIVLVVLLIYLFFDWVRSRLVIPAMPTKLHYIFYLMFLWTFISIAWSVSLNHTINYLFYIFCGTSLVLSVIFYARDLERQRKVFTVLGIFFMIEIIFSLMEALTDFRLPVSPFSFIVEEFGREMKVDLTAPQNVLDIVFAMPTGFQWNSNNLAATMNIILPFFLFHRNIITRWLGAAAIFVIISYSTSRGNMIALVAVFTLWLIFYQSSRRLINLSLLIIPVVGMLILFPPRLDQVENESVARVQQSFDALTIFLFEEVESDSNSISIRQQMTADGWNMLKNSYGLGMGGGGSTAAFIQKGGLIGKTGNLHNFWLEILVDLGVAFFIPFIIWYIYIYRRLRHIYWRAQNLDLKYYAAACSLAMAGFTIGVISTSSAIYLFPMWILFGFCLATINNYQELEVEK
jgi:teichuronic acid biosynthesis protein TuaE